MQLEIKTIIDFGDNDPLPHEMNDILRLATKQLEENVLQPVCRIYGAKATTCTGWTSSQDDEPEDDDTYEVVKFFQDPSKGHEILHTSLTLDAAKEIVNGPDTEGDGWFIGFRKE